MKDKTKKAAGGQAPTTAAKPKVNAAAAPEAPADAKPAVEAAPTTYESILAQIKKAQEA